MKDPETAEEKEKSNLRFFWFLFFELWSFRDQIVRYQIVLVPNCPGTELSLYRIVRDQIVRDRIVRTPFTKKTVKEEYVFTVFWIENAFATLVQSLGTPERYYSTRMWFYLFNCFRFITCFTFRIIQLFCPLEGTLGPSRRNAITCNLGLCFDAGCRNSCSQPINDRHSCKNCCASKQRPKLKEFRFRLDGPFCF